MTSQELHANKPHILVVDDDTRICDLVCRYLLDQGFVVASAADAAQARELLKMADFDAAVIDVMMPGESGLDLVKDITVPAIMLTALGEVNDRIAGLEAGADDYLVKPFEPQELVLRLHALLRRTMKPSQAQEPVRLGDLTFNPATGALEGRDSTPLTEAEGAILKTLTTTPGEVVSRDTLADKADIASPRAVDVQVTRLRRKIETDSANPRYILTARGKGYYFRPRMDGEEVAS